MDKILFTPYLRYIVRIFTREIKYSKLKTVQSLRLSGTKNAELEFGIFRCNIHFSILEAYRALPLPLSHVCGWFRATLSLRNSTLIRSLYQFHVSLRPQAHPDSNS